MKVTVANAFTGIENTLDLDITQEQFDRLNIRHEVGEKVQDIVPHLSADEREFLINGLLPGEFDEIHGPEEEN